MGPRGPIDRAALDQFNRHLQWAREIGRSYRMPGGLKERGLIEHSDVMVLAMSGLWDAARRYPELDDLNFRSVAFLRVTGAIRDGMRTASPLPRRGFRTGLRAYMEELGDETAATPAVESDPFATLIVERVVARARAALPSDRYRVVLDRCILSDERHMDVANDLGCSTVRVSQMKSRIDEEISRALRVEGIHRTEPDGRRAAGSARASRAKRTGT